MLELCGGTLVDLLRRVNQKHKQRGLPVVDVVVLGICLADATLAVHEFAHSLHLDIKPENVLLRTATSQGEEDTQGKQIPVITDFGLMHKLAPRVQDSLPSATRASLVSGVAEGTPGYASPEQGEHKGGRKSDVYSIGATLLFAASFKHPYGGATAAGVGRKHADGVCQVPDALLSSTCAVCRHARSRVWERMFQPGLILSCPEQYPLNARPEHLTVLKSCVDGIPSVDIRATCGCKAIKRTSDCRKDASGHPVGNTVPP